MITENPSFHFCQKRRFHIQCVRATTQPPVLGALACIHQWVMFRWILGTSLLIILSLTVKKRCQSSKLTDGFQRYGKCTQMTPEVVFFLNLSKKVKCYLFCINLDTGYLYVIVLIPKAFSLLSHHSRVVFTISKTFNLLLLLDH